MSVSVDVEKKDWKEIHQMLTEVPVNIWFLSHFWFGFYNRVLKFCAISNYSSSKLRKKKEEEIAAFTAKCKRSGGSQGGR